MDDLPELSSRNIEDAYNALWSLRVKDQSLPSISHKEFTKLVSSGKKQSWRQSTIKARKVEFGTKTNTLPAIFLAFRRRVICLSGSNPGTDPLPVRFIHITAAPVVTEKASALGVNSLTVSLPLVDCIEDDGKYNRLIADLGGASGAVEGTIHIKTMMKVLEPALASLAIQKRGAPYRVVRIFSSDKGKLEELRRTVPVIDTFDLCCTAYAQLRTNQDFVESISYSHCHRCFPMIDEIIEKLFIESLQNTQVVLFGYDCLDLHRYTTEFYYMDDDNSSYIDVFSEYVPRLNSSKKVFAEIANWDLLLLNRVHPDIFKTQRQFADLRRAIAASCSPHRVPLDDIKLVPAQSLPSLARIALR